MSGRFAKLNPNSDERKAFWEKHSDKICSWLKEINTDVFDGKGKFGEAGFEGYYKFPPQLTEPNLFINFDGYGSLSVCTASTTKFRVIVEKSEFTSHQYKSVECGIEILDTALEAFVKYLVG